MALQLTVVTPEGQAYEGEVEQVVLPGSEGDFGVLEQHERYLAALRPGVLEIHAPGSGAGGKEWAAVSDGFADVSAEAVTVLVSRCDLAAAIDTKTLVQFAYHSERTSSATAQLRHVNVTQERGTENTGPDHRGRMALTLTEL